MADLLDFNQLLDVLVGKITVWFAFRLAGKLLARAARNLQTRLAVEQRRRKLVLNIGQLLVTDFNHHATVVLCLYI